MSDHTRDTSTWPIGLRRIAEIIGPAAAVRLADAIGGTEDNYVPKQPTITHPFVPIIGLDRTELLARAFGGKRIDIPRGVYRESVKARIIDAGPQRPAREVALEARCTQRYVRMIRNAGEDDGRQPSLFDHKMPSPAKAASKAAASKAAASKAIASRSSKK